MTYPSWLLSRPDANQVVCKGPADQDGSTGRQAWFLCPIQAPSRWRRVIEGVEKTYNRFGHMNRGAEGRNAQCRSPMICWLHTGHS
jgi:hypothetical protein